jgi:hypothetical protein
MRILILAASRRRKHFTSSLKSRRVQSEEAHRGTLVVESWNTVLPAWIAADLSLILNGYLGPTPDHLAPLNRFNPLNFRILQDHLTHKASTAFILFQGL